ncbi:hypothetical protein MMC30_000629 [Trapelia coarctata]|nr:hypothetical protein [Trapelia coarctata]
MSPTSWHHLPLEIKIMILNQASDFTSLNSLITIDPALTPYLCESSTTLLPAILAKSLPKTTQYILQEHFMIQKVGKRPYTPFGRSTLSRIIDYRTESYVYRGRGQAWVSLLADNPISVLREIAQIQKAIDYFTWTFLASRCQPPDNGQRATEEPAPSPAELNRIHQALWLFQACCDVSNSWMASVDMWEAEYKLHTRVKQLKEYLGKFGAWELQELESVYDHLAELLEGNAQDSRVDAAGQALDPFALPEVIGTVEDVQRMRAMHGAKAKLLSQGLVSLYNYIRHTDVRTRSTSLERYFGYPDEFIIASLREKSARTLFDLDNPSDRGSRPNGGWECVVHLPLPRLTAPQ